MQDLATKKPTPLPVSASVNLTGCFLAVFTYFGIECSPNNVSMTFGPPCDILTKSLEGFYSFHGVTFEAEAPPRIELRRVCDPLSVDEWCTLVFICAELVERKLGPEYTVENESFNALETSLRNFVAKLGGEAIDAIPSQLPAGWRYQENRDRLQADVDLYWK